MNIARRRMMCGTREVLPQGCIFYAPLKKNDLTDHVSGATMTISQGTVTFDNNYGMYKFEIPANTNSIACAYWDVDFTNDFTLTNNDEYTLYAKVIVPIVNNGRPYLVGLGNFDVNNSYKPNFAGNAVLGTGNSGSIGSIGNPAYAALTRQRSGNSGWLTYYSKNFNESVNSSHMSNPANWSNNNLCAKRVCLLFSRDSNYSAFTAYIKDIYIFNRALSQTEIQNL
jgi:hypothetical protein